MLLFQTLVEYSLLSFNNVSRDIWIKDICITQSHVKIHKHSDSWQNM